MKYIIEVDGDKIKSVKPYNDDAYRRGYLDGYDMGVRLQIPFVEYQMKDIRDEQT